jgi:hypothetical protein
MMFQQVVWWRPAVSRSFDDVCARHISPGSVPNRRVVVLCESQTVRRNCGMSASRAEDRHGVHLPGS